MRTTPLLLVLLFPVFAFAQMDFNNSPNTAVGLMAPDFSQPDTAGVSVTLSELRGSYILLEFWANWCKPCRAENPHIMAMYNRYKDQGFNVVAVSLDSEKDRDKWLSAIVEDGVQDWIHLSDLKGFKNEPGQLYGIQAIPMNFLIDPSGKIVARNLRGDTLDEKLAEVFPDTH